MLPFCASALALPRSLISTTPACAPPRVSLIRRRYVVIGILPPPASTQPAELSSTVTRMIRSAWEHNSPRLNCRTERACVFERINSRKITCDRQDQRSVSREYNRAERHAFDLNFGVEGREFWSLAFIISSPCTCL